MRTFVMRFKLFARFWQWPSMGQNGAKALSQDCF